MYEPVAPLASSLQRSQDGTASGSLETEEEEDFVPYVPVRERKRAALETRLTQQRQPASGSEATENASAEGSRDGVRGSFQ